MDALLTQTQNPVNSLPFWDFQVASNIVPILSGTLEQAQQASVLAYTQLNAIPQLLNVGVNWVGLLMGNDTFANIDSQISTAMHLASLPYKALYSQVNHKIVLNIVPI